MENLVGECLWPFLLPFWPFRSKCRGGKKRKIPWKQLKNVIFTAFPQHFTALNQKFSSQFFFYFATKYYIKHSQRQIHRLFRPNVSFWPSKASNATRLQENLTELWEMCSHFRACNNKNAHISWTLRAMVLKFWTCAQNFMLFQTIPHGGPPGIMWLVKSPWHTAWHERDRVWTHFS